MLEKCLLFKNCWKNMHLLIDCTYHAKICIYSLCLSYKTCLYLKLIIPSLSPVTKGRRMFYRVQKLFELEWLLDMCT